MGIPTVNGAIHFDDDFVGNPLVYCRQRRLLPTTRCARRRVPATDRGRRRPHRPRRHPRRHLLLGRAARRERDDLVGRVQIGDPITEKKVLDAVLRARDEGLFTAVTDCGAGGFSRRSARWVPRSAREVDLDWCRSSTPASPTPRSGSPRRRNGWCLAVPPDKLARLLGAVAEEDSEATDIGAFADHARLVLRWQGTRSRPGDGTSCTTALRA
jgi:phosphoribosylformylglycinamidine synthase